MPKPPIVADLRWQRGLVFEAESSGQTLTIDGDTRDGASPTQLLAIALAGCMAADVAYILAKGRHRVRALRSHIAADRAQTEPHRIVRVALHFTVEGAVPADAVGRAIALSRETYCSVWHSLREDIDFNTTFEVSA